MLTGRQALLTRNTIKDPTEDGLILLLECQEVSVPWSAVTGVSAGRAKLHRDSETWSLLLAFDMEWNGQSRLLIVGEIEPAWLPLTAILHVAFSGIEPFEVWGPELVTNAAPIELYQRAGRPS